MSDGTVGWRCFSVSSVKGYPHTASRQCFQYSRQFGDIVLSFTERCFPNDPVASFLTCYLFKMLICFPVFILLLTPNFISLVSMDMVFILNKSQFVLWVDMRSILDNCF